MGGLAPFEVPVLHVPPRAATHSGENGDEGTKKMKLDMDWPRRKRTLSMEYVHEPCVLVRVIGHKTKAEHQAT